MPIVPQHPSLFAGKVCPRCGCWRPTDGFNRDKNREDGLNVYCKPCRAEMRHADADNIRAYNKLYYACKPDYYAEAQRQRRAEHPEYDREYYARNAERERAKQTAYKIRHPEKIAEYRRRNPHIFQAKSARRRALKRQAPGSHTAAQWKALCESFDNRCVACGERRKLTVDHIVPLSRGGSHDIDNIQPLCGPCNASKYNHVRDYRPQAT